MRKSAEDLAMDVLGREAKEKKRRERWISTLTSGALGTVAGLVAKNYAKSDIPSQLIGSGLTGLLTAQLPNKIWENPIDDADDPRWWRRDYSPVEHGLALGAGSGVGAAGGHALWRALQSKGMLIPDTKKPLKGILGTIAVLGLPSVAGYLGARKLMYMRDARRDADAQIPNSPTTF